MTTKTKLTREQQVAKLRAQFGGAPRKEQQRPCPGCAYYCGECRVEGGALD